MIERRTHDVLRRREHADELRLRQHASRASAVHLRAPQRLVGVDVADTADDALIEQHPLDRDILAAHEPRDGARVERLLERVRRDVRDRRGHLAPVRHRQVVEEQPAERPLVDEAHLLGRPFRARPLRCVSHPRRIHRLTRASALPRLPGRRELHRRRQVEHRMRMLLQRRVGALDEHLSTHAEVDDEGVVGHRTLAPVQRHRRVRRASRSRTDIFERHPQVLAAPLGRRYPSSEQCVGQMLRPRQVTACDARARHPGRDEGPADHVVVQASSYDFHLGKLRHAHRP